jgi:histidinol-phosphate aminotransferase
MIVIDEAYIDFADGDQANVSMIDAINRYDNLIVLRTFSKSYSLAGARVGLLFANPELITEFNKVKDSYNVNAMSQVAARTALCDTDYHQDIVSKTVQSRWQLEEQLQKYGWSWPTSQANFLLCHVGSEAGRIYQQLKDHGILVRWWKTPELSNYLRITAGTPEENQALFNALDALLT